MAWTLPFALWTQWQCEGNTHDLDRAVCRTIRIVNHVASCTADQPKGLSRRMLNFVAGASVL